MFDRGPGRRSEALRLPSEELRGRAMADDPNVPRRSPFRPLKWAVLATAVLGLLAHFFYDRLPTTLQTHLAFLK
jgi:hypothetical protein